MNMHQFNYPTQHSMLNYEQDCWLETTFITHQAILVFVSLINEKYIFYRPFRDPKVPKGLYYRPRSVNTDHLGTLYYVLPLMFLGLCH